MHKFLNGMFGRTSSEPMRAAWRRVTRCESGQSLVEVALGVSLCGILMLGAVEFGRLAYAGIEVSDAARVGVEYGSQSHALPQDIANMQTAASRDAPDVSNLTATATQFCQCADGTSSTCATTDCSGRPILYVQVVTSASVDPLIYVPGLPKSYTLSGKAVMRVVQ
jgi:Flp pilus assembly protein TadG